MSSGHVYTLSPHGRRSEIQSWPVIADRGASGVFAGSIRNSGTVEANAVTVDEDGTIRLVARNDLTLFDDYHGGDDDSITVGDEGTVQAGAHSPPEDEDSMSCLMQELQGRQRSPPGTERIPRAVFRPDGTSVFQYEDEPERRASRGGESG